MLKSLAVTIAQVSQRIAGRGDLPDDFDPANDVARRAERRRRRKTILVLTVVFIVMVALFSTAFHELMDREGRSFSWATSIYWTLTTMTTLGFGDITFTSDAGLLAVAMIDTSGAISRTVNAMLVLVWSSRVATTIAACSTRARW